MTKLNELLKEINENFHIDGTKNVILDHILSLLVGIFAIIAYTVSFPLILVLGIINCICNLSIKIYKLLFNDPKLKKKVKKAIWDHQDDLFRSNGGNNYYLKDFFYNVENYTLESFIILFINEYKDYYDTYEENTNRYICNRGKRRSLGDIYLICKYYFPECGIENVLKILIKLLLRGTIQGSYCNTIHKYVFYIGSNSIIYDNKVEYDNTLRIKDIINTYK